MRIVIDGRMYGPRRWTGIGRYLQQLIAQLERLDHEHEYVVLIGQENWEDYQPSARNFTKQLAPYPPYSLGEQLGLGKQLYDLKPDLVHFAAPNAPILYLGRHITTVHDLTLLYFSTSRGDGIKKWLHDAKRLPFRLVLWWRAKFSQQLLTPTEYVKDQLVERYHLAPDKARAVLLGIDPARAEPESIGRFGLKDGYLLYVGNCYPYKFGQLLEAFEQLAPRHPELQLVLVGRDDYFRLRVKDRAKALGLEKQVVFTGGVSDGELSALYQRAGLFVYPSLSEGFGLQGLEAMAQGVPVIAARASCLPEVYEDAAAYFDPRDSNDMAEAMESLLRNPERLERLRQAGLERVKQFSWERMARETLEVYRRALRHH